jgi:RND superfamily putative drug exporter
MDVAKVRDGVLLRRWAASVVVGARGWIVAWFVAAGAIWVPAPRIPTLLGDDATSFLPADSASQRGVATLRREFPDAAPASRAVVVAARPDGLSAADREYLGKVARALHARNSELGWRVRAVELSPYLRPILESPDGKAAVIAVDLPAEMLTHSSVRRVREIRQVLTQVGAPPGLEVQITGAAAMGELLDANAKRDVDRTTLWAFAAVTVILLLIYRSPIAMLLPLMTIALALMVGLGAVGWAAGWGWPVNDLVEMFIIVLVVGTGVDYCLFLFSRLREEYAACGEHRQATEAALVHAGPAILASAGTVAAGLATLYLARNRDLYVSGPTIAFAVGVSALAVMTLAPALMRVAGPRLLGLRRASAGHDAETESRLWRLAARTVTQRPVAVLLATALLLIPTSIVGALTPKLYDSLAEYPQDSSFVRGARLYYTHFYAGRPVAELTVLISAPTPWAAGERSTRLHEALDSMAEALRNELPVLYQRDAAAPLGRAQDGTNPSGSAAESQAPTVANWLGAQFYMGASGSVTRVDIGLAAEPRSPTAMEWTSQVRRIASEALATHYGPSAGEDLTVDVAGESAVYADMRDLRTRDFRVVGVAAGAAIFVILLFLTRAAFQSLILVGATVVTYLATYGATYLIVRSVFGLDGLSWQIEFLLFIIIMSLGQDYNIFVVARIREELRTHPPRQAVDLAIRRTGKIVSSCGIIMAATFASMFSGSLLVLKEFAIALPLGILIDTFLVRPLLVPALILLLTPPRGHADAAPIPAKR